MRIGKGDDVRSEMSTLKAYQLFLYLLKMGHKFSPKLSSSQHKEGSMIHLMGHSNLEMKTKYSFRKRPITGTITIKTFPMCLNKSNIRNYNHTYILPI